MLLKPKSLFIGPPILILTALFLSVSCSDDPKDDPSQPAQIVTGMMKDPDGNTIKTVVIGQQEWTSENWHSTHYSDGTTIPYVPSDTAWANLTSGGLCPPGGNADNQAIYGLLYNAWVVNSGKLAPAGWRVPTDDDWKTLVTTLGGAEKAGAAMKAPIMFEWGTDDFSSATQSGFNALTGGYRDGWGKYYWMSAQSVWWTAQSGNPAVNSSVRLQKGQPNVLISTDKIIVQGYSIRLVKDKK